ncbi:hypothetical protein IGI04_039600 [Brassica rapa subsp. trilocularis]|uniref:Uncharacterized protein n=1 Tax=Brassica rapa subsp. trilocularis TaxID=1813537 RepID=A0ABQ7KLA9_BRACM|nr:hypothetical protein IGI04_039600 [Brassica rapa subsp. trilocularis]
MVKNKDDEKWERIEHTEGSSLLVDEKSKQKQLWVEEEDSAVKGNAWVSPAKVGKAQASPAQSTKRDIVISASKFSILLEEKEEGEI